MTQSSSFRAPTAPPGLLSSEPTGVCWINLGCLIAILNSDHYTYRQYTNRQFFFASLQTFQLAIKHFKPIYCSCDHFFRVGLFSTLIFDLTIYSNHLPRFLAETNFASMKGHFRFFSALCDLPKEKNWRKIEKFWFFEVFCKRTFRTI